MARGYGRRRGMAISPMVIVIIAVVSFALLVGAVFWFAGQADGRRPEQTTIRVEATNVGPQSESPAEAPNAPAQ